MSVSCTAGLSVVDLSAESKGAYPLHASMLDLLLKQEISHFFYNPVCFCFNPKSPGGGGGGALNLTPSPLLSTVMHMQLK